MNLRQLQHFAEREGFLELFGAELLADAVEERGEQPVLFGGKAYPSELFLRFMSFELHDESSVTLLWDKTYYRTLIAQGEFLRKIVHECELLLEWTREKLSTYFELVDELTALPSYQNWWATTKRVFDRGWYASASSLSLTEELRGELEFSQLWSEGTLGDPS